MLANERSVSDTNRYEGGFSTSERLPEGDRKAALDVKPNIVVPPTLRNRITAWEKIPRPRLEDRGKS